MLPAVEYIIYGIGLLYFFSSYCTGYSMDVIASAAFGMDIDAQTSLDHPFVKHAGTFFGIPRNITWYSKLQQIVKLFVISKLMQ